MPEPVLPADYPRCGVITRSKNKPCPNPRMRNATRCRLHGGKTPRSLASAARIDIQQKAEKALKRMNITPVTDPLSKLQELAGEVIAWKNEIRRHIYDLKTIRSVTGLGIEQTRSEIILYERALDRCVVILSNLAKLGIEERLAMIDEKQAKLLEDALFAAMDAAGIPITDTAKRRAVAKSFVNHLTVAG